MQAAENEAKFWLAPVSLAANHGFRGRDLHEIEQLVRDNETQLVEAWNDYFA